MPNQFAGAVLKIQLLVVVIGCLWLALLRFFDGGWLLRVMGFLITYTTLCFGYLLVSGENLV
jgi:hypothetical protein